MCFWEFEDSEKEVIITPERKYSYKELNDDIKLKQAFFQSEEKKELVLILCKNQYETLNTYLAALRSNHVAMLISEDTDEELLQQILQVYKPLWINTTRNIPGYGLQMDGLLKRETKEKVDIFNDLAVMLSTSGTTGSQKFVRLSYKNIEANAESIVEYLQINDKERGIANLPISYSYGLSIINSHLKAGATILLTEESVISKTFWEFFNTHKATSFGGVPFTYQMLQRIGFTKQKFPHLNYFTQAGGRLDERLVKRFSEYALNNRHRFYVMYGQTEASPRISYIPPERTLEKAGTIGQPIPNGYLEIDHETKELIYKGPNVMLGYALCLDDLKKGDEQFGILYTGDTASKDEDGFYTITGRMKRFVKLFGLRVNLDEVEKMLEGKLQKMVACTGEDDRLMIVIETKNMDSLIHEAISEMYKLHRSAYQIHVMEKIPRFSNGKTNYSQLKEWLL